jgi:ferrous iron transport protein B
MSAAAAPLEPSGTPPAAPARYVALAGNPNCGKTTVFNHLTGLRHRVGNYAGVTVERREGRLRDSEVTVLDLPGTYSLNARSPDEEIARDVLLGLHPPSPELVVVVVDASNLERNLYLLTQVLDLGLPAVLCLNMTDVAARVGLEIDVPALERELGIPVIPAVALRGEGLDALRNRLLQAPPPRPPRRWQLPDPMETEVAELTREAAGSGAGPSAFFQVVTLLSQPDIAPPANNGSAAVLHERAQAARKRLEALEIDPESAPVEGRYAWIQEVCTSATDQGPIPVTWSDRVDRVVTHRVGGFVCFFALMALMFQAIFTWAKPPMDWIDERLAALGGWVGSVVPAGDFNSLLVDGVIAGVGSVLIFVPQIFFMLFFLGLLEDSGYMARAAFVMDRVMGRVGLHGKSFIPLLSSFACAIPGILATRTIENRRDRMVTILVAPLMSCSARLPVYTLLIAGFIPATRLWGVLSLPALVMVSMYLLGLLAALLMAGLFKATLFRSEPPLFLMELPPYKLPSARTVLLQTWERGSEFLKRAGTIILLLSILLWFAMHYPGGPATPAPQRLEGSIAGHAGRLLEPMLRPFGMDWKVGIGVIGSFVAREVFVSTMAIVYSVDADDETQQSQGVRQRMQAEVDAATGRPRFTPLSAVALMVFYVLAMQCVSTMAIVRKETGSWKWPLVQWAYMLVLAWCGATGVFQVGRLLGWG